MKRAANRKRAAAALLCALLLWCFPASVSAYSLPEDVSIRADAAMVVFLGADAGEDQVMFEKNADTPVPPAGLVRILLGTYASELIDSQGMDPARATGTYTAGLAEQVRDLGLVTVNMQEGDVWHLDDLLTVSVIQTAADAVTVLMQTLAGGQETFVQGMNDLLGRIGCTGSHVANAYGLDDPQQVFTARDTYLMLRYVSLHCPRMLDILGKQSHTVHPVVGESDYWPTTNTMLREDTSEYYSPLAYGRSGYTESNGQSLASVARDGGFEYMTVVIGCRPAPAAKGEKEDSNPAFTDTRALFRWVYNAFTYRTIINQGQPVDRVPVALSWQADSVPLVAAQGLERMVRSEVDVKALRFEIALDENPADAPLEKGQILGKVSVYDGDELVGEVPLASAQAVSRSALLAMVRGIWRVISHPVMLTVLAVLAAVLIGTVVVSAVHNHSRKAKRRKSVKRYR